MLSIGLSTCGFDCLCEENFINLKESGIKTIEISKSNYDNFDFGKLKKLSSEYEIEVWSLHLPFSPFELLDPSSLDAKKSKHSFDTFIDIISKAGKIGIKRYIVHPSCEPIPDNERKERLSACAEFLSRLADEAEKHGAVIAVEDLPRTCLGNCSDDILSIISSNEKLRVCFDTNHLLGENNAEFIKKIGSKIITLHVSDYDFVNERHWLPGEGDNNWNEIFNELMKIGYNGAWMYEIGLNPSKTIERRVITFKDFYNNAMEIFGGNNPTPIGKRIENLGFWGPV